MEAFEGREYRCVVLRVDANAVVLYRDLPLVAFATGRNPHDDRLPAAKFGAVGNQILQQLDERIFVSRHRRRHEPHDNPWLCLFDESLQVFHNGLHARLEVNRTEGLRGPSRAGVFQKAVQHLRHAVHHPKSRYEKLIAPGVQRLVSIEVKYHFHIVSYRAQGGLQIVRGNRNESFQLSLLFGY